MICRILGLLLITTASAAAGDWRLDPASSRLSFSGDQAGTAFTGQFERFSTDITFDPDNLDTAAITVTIDMASAESGSAERDSTLPGSDWFDTARFPQATFIASVVNATDNGYVAEGSLTIKGTSRQVSLPFSLEINGDTAHATGGLTINRNDYNIGTGPMSPMVAPEVAIAFDIRASR